MPANSFATFFKAVYPDQAQVLNTSGPYGDPVNVYSAGTAVPGAGGGDDAATIYAYFTDSSREDAFKADVSGLSTFDSTTDQVVASNMRGTDGANTVAPDNASISSILTISAKHDTALESDGLGGWQYTELALENGPSGAGGSGLYQVTVRVQDTSLNALQGARVNVDGTVLTLTTDSSGECVFNLDSGIYTLNVSPPAGYDTPTGNVVTVSTSDTSTTFTLTETDPGGGGDCDVPWVG